MNDIQRYRFRSFSLHTALGFALALSACATRAPVAPPEPPAQVAASVQALRYAVEVVAVDADTDLGDISGMITQALIEGGYAIAKRDSESDVVLAASLVAARVNSGMTVVVNGQERVERAMKLTLRAQSPSGDRVVDQTTREFSTKEPRVPATEIAAAVNKLGAGEQLETYAAQRVAKAKADADAKADAEAKAAEDAEAAEELAARTRGCRQLRDDPTDAIVKNFNQDRKIDFLLTARVFSTAANWCDVEETQRNRARIIEAAKDAPPFKGGQSSKRLTPLARKKLLRLNLPGLDFVKAVATAKKKNFVNRFGASMGTIRRVAVVASVGDGAACFMVRGNWRVSTLLEDQDDPEYVKLDTDGAQMFAMLVQCPKK